MLGKTFYKGQTKRPVPVSIQEPAPKTDGKRIAKAKDEKAASRGAGSAKMVAGEIEKATGCALVSLTPSTNTAVVVGYAHWDAEKLAANVEAVSLALIEKFVPKKWRGVRGLYIKGASTAALPIWLAEELWENEADVLVDTDAQTVAQANVGKKRKAIDGADVKEGGENKKQKLESNDDTLDNEIRERKEKLKKQKAEAALDVAADEAPRAAKKAKKGKGKAVAV